MVQFENYYFVVNFTLHQTGVLFWVTRYITVVDSSQLGLSTITTGHEYRRAALDLSNSDIFYHIHLESSLNAIIKIIDQAAISSLRGGGL